MTTSPPVSVVIATHDRPALLRATLDTILAQDYPGDVEILVVHDQSVPDESLTVELPGRRVRVLANDRTPGLAGARNSGVLASTGDLLAFCDDDDTWLPDKLRLQVDALERSGAGLALTGIYVQYGDRVTVRIPEAAELTVAGLTRDRIMAAHPSTYLVRRTTFDEIGLVDEEIPGSYGEDWDWLLRAVQHTDVVVVPRPLIRVLWHKGSFFNRRWLTIIEALDHLVDKHPSFAADPLALARVYGQKAFAYAAAGQRDQARACAREALKRSKGERRAYLALLVANRLLRAETVMRMANAAGRGI